MWQRLADTTHHHLHAAEAAARRLRLQPAALLVEVVELNLGDGLHRRERGVAPREHEAPLREVERAEHPAAFERLGVLELRRARPVRLRRRLEHRLRLAQLLQLLQQQPQQRHQVPLHLRFPPVQLLRLQPQPAPLPSKQVQHLARRRAAVQEVPEETHVRHKRHLPRGGNLRWLRENRMAAPSKRYGSWVESGETVCGKEGGAALLLPSRTDAGWS